MEGETVSLFGMLSRALNDVVFANPNQIDLKVLPQNRLPILFGFVLVLLW